MKFSLPVTVFISANLFSQNLIVNPGFEDHPGVKITAGTSVCINSVSIPGWTDPTDGTSDLYIYAEGQMEGRVSPKPDSGDSYGGFWGSKGGLGTGEYLQGMLSAPLVKNSTYHISISVWVSNNGNYDDVNSLGISFSSSLRKDMSGLAETISLESDMKFSTQKIITKEGRWNTYFQDYIANGSEKYFILGTFRDPESRPRKDDASSTYFYVDNLSLTGKRAPGPIPDDVFQNDTVWTKHGNWKQDSQRKKNIDTHFYTAPANGQQNKNERRNSGSKKNLHFLLRRNQKYFSNK
ncbi:MAG: hypothetical protein HY064_14525 [Bacteroidetes bacterium]|nr:hypothetical protein [Bacteroidota bacterium]